MRKALALLLLALAGCAFSFDDRGLHPPQPMSPFDVCVRQCERGGRPYGECAVECR